MGLGSPAFALAWAPARAAVLALNVGTAIQNPAVLLGAAAVVVIAVLIVLIMVLRGGSKKAEMVPEMEDDQQIWEPAPQGAIGQSGRGYDPRDQMLPWEQGGSRADGGRQQAGAKRGPTGRDAQEGWNQPEDYAQSDARWEAPGQAAPRGGQWGADQWASSEVAPGRAGMEPRVPQGQMASRDQEEWGWGANPAAGAQSADQWGQGAAASPMAGREADQWGQRKSPSSPAMDRKNDQWGQAPGGFAASGREQDQWGQSADPPASGWENNQWGQAAAASPAMGRENDQWGRTPGEPSAMGREQDQWGQGPTASPSGGRESDQWGQGAAMRGRGQDQWGQPPPATGRGGNQPEDQNIGMRSGPRRGAEADDEAAGQWQQGSWGQDNAARNGSVAADRWGPSPQAASSPQVAGPSHPNPSRPINQGNLGNMAGQPQGGGEWGERNFERPSQSGAQPDSAWGAGREASPWQADPRQEPPAWDSPGQRGSSPSRPQWEQAGRAATESTWERGGADEWGQPAQAPKPSTSRPAEPAGARGMEQPLASTGEWGERDFERPTARSGQPSGGREQREPSPWQAAPEPSAPAWQPPAAQMAAPAGQVEAPMDRRGPDMRQIPRGSPDDTAYGPPKSGGESEGEDAKTVVMRKDAGAGRLPAVVVRQGKEPGRTYEMRKEQIRIGRSRESDIFLEDLAVSRLHATIYRDEMGVYQLRDENSANGTSVNGQRVTECTLQEGDEIQLGQTILAFVRR